MWNFHLFFSFFLFRSGSSNGTNKFDGAPLPASSNGRTFTKNELEKVSLSRDSISCLSKERLKGNNKYVLSFALARHWYLVCIVFVLLLKFLFLIKKKKKDC